jgi:hypothetical protein
LKVSEEGLAEIVGMLETINDTLTTCDAAPGAEMVTVPL